MYDYEILNHVPNAVIVYKEDSVEFINQQILEILSVEFLSKKFAIDIILKIMEVRDEKTLKDFFLINSYFLYKKKFIQINHSQSGDRTIFIFTFVNDNFKCVEKAPKHKLDLEQNKIIKMFMDISIRKVKTLLYHKGLPLKANCEVHRILADHIEVKLEPKQMISLKNRKDIHILPTNDNAKTAIEGEICESKGQIVHIRGLKTVPLDNTTREEIRLIPSPELTFNSKQGDLEIYDISPTGISFHYNREFKYEKVSGGFLLYHDKRIPINITFIKVLEDLKAIYTIDTIDNSFIESYMAERQIDIIQEIQNYTKKNFPNE